MTDDWIHDMASQLADRNDYVVVLEATAPKDETDHEEAPSQGAVGIITSSYGTGSTLVVEVGADDAGSAFMTVRSYDGDGGETTPSVLDGGDSLLIYAGLETDDRKE